MASADIERIVIYPNDNGYGVRTLIQSVHHAKATDAMCDGEIGPFECREVAEHFAAEMTAAKNHPVVAGKESAVMNALRRAYNARNARSMSDAFPQKFNLAFAAAKNNVHAFDQNASMALIAFSFVLTWGAVGVHFL